jgi:type IV fimbrial biogenesis protein FimT
MNGGGFSVLELMVAVAILGIALAIATPNFTRSLRVAQADRAQSELQSDIRLAMSTARARGRAVRLVFNANGYVIMDATDSTTVRTRTFDDGLSFASSGDPLIFPWGQVQPASLSISCPTSGSTNSLTLSPSGRLATSGGQ